MHMEVIFQEKHIPLAKSSFCYFRRSLEPMKVLWEPLQPMASIYQQEWGLQRDIEI